MYLDLNQFKYYSSEATSLYFHVHDMEVSNKAQRETKSMIPRL